MRKLSKRKAFQRVKKGEVSALFREDDGSYKFRSRGVVIGPFPHKEATYERALEAVTTVAILMGLNGDEWKEKLLKSGKRTVRDLMLLLPND